MKKLGSIDITAHLCRGAFCLILTLSLALAGPVLGQTKSAHPDNGQHPANSSISFATSFNGTEGAAHLPGELVTNGGFETGDFSGWTQSGDTSFTFVELQAAHSGTYGAAFGPRGSNGYITQALATMAGGRYDLVFWLRNTGSTPNHFEVSWDGSIVDSIDNGPAMPYNRYTYSGLEARYRRRRIFGLAFLTSQPFGTLMTLRSTLIRLSPKRISTRILTRIWSCPAPATAGQRSGISTITLSSAAPMDRLLRRAGM